MNVVFLKYIFVENLNTSSRSHQPIPWNCNDKILGAKEPRANIWGRGPRAEKSKYPEKNVIHQIDSKNEWLLLSVTFMAKFELVFVLTFENAFP